MAELHFMEGQSEKALESLEKILALTGDMEDVESKRLRWGALVTTFDIHYSEGRTDSARRALEEAESIVDEIGLSLDRVETYRRRARICLDEGEIPRAVEELETAVGIIETLRTSPEAEEQRIRFLAAQESVYKDLAAIHLRNIDQPLEAFIILERSRSRAFLDSLHGGVRLSSDERGALTVVLSSSAEPEPIERVVSALPPGGALIHYTVAPHWLGVLSFDQGGLRSWRVIDIDANELGRMARRFTRQARAESPHETDTADSALAKVLLESVKETLTEYQTLIIVPDGVLFGIPWAALPWEGSYLIQEHRLVVEPSASVFVRLTERVRRPAAASALLVANPTFGDVSASPDRAVAERVRPLPEAEAEAREIAALLAGAVVLHGEDAKESSVRSSMGRYDLVHFGTHAWIVADQPLSSSLLLSGGAWSVEGARLDPVAPSDGVLTGYEVLGIELRQGAMITLAACESIGRGAGRGEGVVGLARGFFEAGAGTVLGSLWPVEDRATRRLMVRFYQQIAAGGRSTAEALSRAQAAVAKGEAGERRRHPYYWAGFILIGDGR
jgi:CHAT domain-containing protein